MAIALLDLLRGVGADGHHLNIALVEIGPQFFPSPQLGDTVGSPVASEELDEDRLAVETR